MHAVSAAGAADHWAHVRSFGTGLSLPVYRQKGAGEADVPYLEMLILFSFIVFVWEFYLDVRQYRALQRKDIPSALTERIAELDSRATASGSAPPEQASRSKDDPSPPAATSLLDRLTSKFEAARKYSIDKAHLGFVETAFSQTENTTLLLLGSMPWFWDISVELAGRWLGNRENEYVVSLVLLGLNMVLEQVVHLPFSLWVVFVVEERHGFNKQSLGNFFLDKLKGLVLSALLGGPMTLAVLYVIKAGGRSFFLYLYLLVLAFQLLLLTIYPTVIAPLFNKYEPLPEDSELKIQIDALASRVKFPLTKVFVVDGSRRSAHSNAYFYGFFKNKRIVLFDTLIAQVGPHLPTPPRKVEGRKVALPHPYGQLAARTSGSLCLFSSLSPPAHPLFLALPPCPTLRAPLRPRPRAGPLGALPHLADVSGQSSAPLPCLLPLRLFLGQRRALCFLRLLLSPHHHCPSALLPSDLVARRQGVKLRFYPLDPQE